MKITLILFLLAAVVSIAGLLVLARISRSGAAPGLVAGQLAPCPSTPNCVWSEGNRDARHSIAPVVLPPGGASAVLPFVKEVVREMGGVLTSENEHYVAAEFSSAVFGFVDDMEVRVDATGGLLHLRSASRIGYGDAGVNRKRLVLFTQLLERKVSAAGLRGGEARR